MPVLMYCIHMIHCKHNNFVWYVFTGEKVYIARIAVVNENKHVKFPPKLIPAFVTSSKKAGAVTYFTLPQYSPLEIKLSSGKKYEVLTCKIPDLLYWEPFENISVDHFRSTVIFSYVSDREASFALFYGQAKTQDKQGMKISKCHQDYANGLGKITGDDNAKFDFSNEACQSHFYTMCSNDIIEVSKFSVLCFHQVPKLINFCCPTVKWVDISDDNFPPNSFPVALSTNGDNLYVVKGDNKKESKTFITPITSLLGKIQYVSWPFYAKHTEYKCSVLVVDDPSTVEWCAFLYESKTRPPPPLAVPMKCNWPHLTSCIGRKVDGDRGNSPMKNTAIIGIIYTDIAVTNITWDIYGGGVPSCFDVLVARVSPKSLKELCRNVIISTTLAIPDRINQLSLPNFLKEFCKLSTKERLTLPCYK